MVNHEAEDHTRIFLRPIANPMPMGFVGLAGGTTILSALQLGWVPTAQATQVGIAVLAIAVPLQLIASVMGYLCRDPVVTTGFGTLAVSWLTIGLLTVTGSPGARSAVLGIVLFYLAAAVLVSAAVAGFGKLLPSLVLVLACARFVLTGVYQYYGGTTWMQVAGWVGVALAAVAIYAAFALEIESLLHRSVLPTGRHGAGRAVLLGSGLDPVGEPQHEAGVRGQL